MIIDRRHFMAGAALAGAATSLPLAVRAEEGAAAAQSLAQAPAFHRISIGDAVVTALSDGSLGLDASVLPTVSQEAFDEALHEAFLPAGAYTAPVNAYVVQRAGRTVLVDAGGSSAMAPTLGHLPQNLAAAGVTPEDVEAVLITHLHPDHIGALTGPDGAAFPNAEIIVKEAEIAFWTDPATRAALPEAFRPMVDAVIATAAAYEGRITRFSGEETVVPGIEAVALPGHTPGHTGYRISDGDASLLLWGDIVHVAPVQMPRPEIFIGFDVTPEEAVATRLAILDEVASERTMIGGMHLPFPGFGHVARQGEGYAFVSAPWQYDL